MLLRLLWHSHLFSSDKALNVILCPVLATAVEKHMNQTMQSTAIKIMITCSQLRKCIAESSFLKTTAAAKKRKLFFIQISWTIKRRNKWQVIIDIIIMSNKLDISKSLLFEIFWKYREPSFENYLGIIFPQLKGVNDCARYLQALR